MESTKKMEYYDAPSIQVVEIKIEKGFAATGDDHGNGGGIDFGSESTWN